MIINKDVILKINNKFRRSWVSDSDFRLVTPLRSIEKELHFEDDIFRIKIEHNDSDILKMKIYDKYESTKFPITDTIEVYIPESITVFGKLVQYIYQTVYDVVTNILYDDGVEDIPPEHKI